MKLWQKNLDTASSDLQERVEHFTVGSDRHWDLYLAKSDVEGSVAHADMLLARGLLTAVDHRLIIEGLGEISLSIHRGEFEIEQGVEDVHSQIELLLIRSKGEAGKKIHSGRSRNDQSLLDIKLFVREQIISVSGAMTKLFETLISLSERYKDKMMPGYTHMQVAMPSSFGLWFGAYAESLSDDLEMLTAAYHIANRNPLGSGAGYGTSFPLDRQATTLQLGFEDMNYNAVYAQMTRGKTEKITAMALACIAATLSRLAMDVCLYMGQDFGFFALPDELVTGSSIMPHKKNPDVFELLRARCNCIQALPNEITMLVNNLPSGYHRDMQLTKECLFPAIFDLIECLDMATIMLQHIEVKPCSPDDPKYRYLFTVETVNRMVLSGMPFRDAYREVGQQVESGTYIPHTALDHTHEGSIGNLCNERIREVFYSRLEKLKR